MPIVATTLKNTLTHTVVKLVGDGTHTITLSTLIDNFTTSAEFESGVSDIVVNDVTGIVIGGEVSGTGITASTTVTAVSGNVVTLSSPTTAESSGVYTFQSQVAVAPVVNICKVFYDTDTTAGIKITRNSVDVLSLTRSGVWQFDGFSLSENNTQNIVVTHSGATASTTILELRKVGGYGDSQHPYRTITTV